MADQTFTLVQAMAAQAALRCALELPPEDFAIKALIGMLSDEIEQMRAVGRSDDDTAALISTATGKVVTPRDIAKFFASSDFRKK